MSNLTAHSLDVIGCALLVTVVASYLVYSIHAACVVMLGSVESEKSKSVLYGLYCQRIAGKWQLVVGAYFTGAGMVFLGGGLNYLGTSLVVTGPLVVLYYTLCSVLYRRGVSRGIDF